MKKVLIANRGEIAVRIIRACRDLGLETVAIYSQADKEALHVQLADEAVCVGEPAAARSYLKIPHILSACEITAADAIHPGYGFLSENPQFASLCEEAGLNFIGPSSKSIALLGDKVEAKSIAKRVKCPVVPGSLGVISDQEEALKIALGIGFPLVIKATHGGGGKGIRVVTSSEEFLKQFVAAQTEAAASFGCADVYLEKMILQPRHIEVQILGDKKGNYIHLGERDCTVQRRRQKLIEEAPGPTLTPALRKRITESALNIAKEAAYFSAGTVEFLLEGENFYFMEVNTRIQVEHTVTEELTGIDLVKAQILVAMGLPLPWKQEDICFKGHVIQCRINAEDPRANFAPSPGCLEDYLPSGGPDVRIDSACYPGYYIPPHYDSMIAKLIVRGANRDEVIAKTTRALDEFYIKGVKSTIPFHQYMMKDPNFRKAAYNIKSIDELIENGCTFEP
jgi:acetyl-CoA carboxylase, biotin carboxylase subunit